MTKSKAFVIGISGHRKLANPNRVRQKVQKFLKVQTFLHPKIIAISGMAEGADTIFAEEALKLEIPLRIILPFPLEYYKTTFSDDTAREMLNKLFNMSKSTSSILNTQPENTDIRRQAYLDCGKKIAEESDIMLLVYDGQTAKGKGGTGDIYKFCMEIKKDMVEIRAEKRRENHITLNILDEEFEDLYKDVDKKRELFQGTYEKLWKTTLLCGLVAAISFSLNIGFGNQLSKFLLTDKLSISFIAQCIEVLAFLIGIYFFFRLEKPKGPYPINKIIDFLFGKRDYKIERLRSRRDREILKYTKIFIEHGITISPLENMEMSNNQNIDSHHYHSKKVEDILAKYHKNESKLKRGQPQDIKNFLINVLIDGKNKSLGQILHHTSTIKRCIHASKILHRLQNVCLLIIMMCISVHLYLALNNVIHTHLNYGIFLNNTANTMSIIMTAFIGAIEAFIYFNEFSRRIKNSGYMLAYFKRKKKELENIDLNEPDNHIKIIEKANEIRAKMDSENLNWFIANDAIAPKL